MRTLQKIIMPLFLLLSITGYSQDHKAEALLQEAMNYMDEQKQYAVDVSYKLYRGLKSTKVYEHYEGFMARDDQKRYQRTDVAEELITPSYYVKLSREDKEMFIGSIPDTLNITQLQWNAQTLLQHFELGTMQDKGTYYTIELIGKKEMLSSIAKMYLDISKTSKRLLKQTMILGYYADFSVYESSGKSDPDAARLELSYSNYTKEINKELFQLNRYFTKTSQTIVPGDAFKGFEVFQSH